MRDDCGWSKEPFEKGRDKQLENIGVGAGASESENEHVVFFFIDEEPIGSDMTFIVARPFTRKGMVVIFGGKRFVVCEHLDDLAEFNDFKTAFGKTAQIFVELFSGSDGVFSWRFHHLAPLKYL